jgi:hypothetical protein
MISERRKRALKPWIRIRRKVKPCIGEAVHVALTGLIYAWPNPGLMPWALLFRAFSAEIFGSAAIDSIVACHYYSYRKDSMGSRHAALTAVNSGLPNLFKYLVGSHFQSVQFPSDRSLKLSQCPAHYEPCQNCQDDSCKKSNPPELE